MFWSIADECPGATPQLTPQEQSDAWEQQIAAYLAEGDIFTAYELMKHQLQQTDEQIKQVLLHPDAVAKYQLKGHIPQIQQLLREQLKMAPERINTVLGLPQAKPEPTRSTAPEPRPVSKPSKTKTKLAVASSSKAPPKKLNTQGAKATTAHGNNILSLLFQHFPELAKGISAESLCLALPAQAGACANTSPLFYLAGSPEGRAILSGLLKDSPELAKGIRAEALCLALPAQAGLDANTSPLYYLADSVEGRAILSELLKENPELARGISAEALCLARPEQAESNANTSPLSCLTDSPDGRNVLQLLAQLNTALAPIIAKSLNPSACQINNYSSLSIFSASSSSHNTLTTDEETGMNPVKRGMLPD